MPSKEARRISNAKACSDVIEEVLCEVHMLPILPTRVNKVTDSMPTHLAHPYRGVATERCALLAWSPYQLRSDHRARSLE